MLTRSSIGALIVAGGAVGQDLTQTDWSGGAGVDGPVPGFGDTFASEHGVAFRSIPGQLALRASPLPAFSSRFEVFAIGDGHEGPPGWHSRRVRVGDFNGDGIPDMAITEINGVAWWEGEGNDEWTYHLIHDSYQAPDQFGSPDLNVADLDRDGDDDVLVAAYHGLPDTNGLGNNGRLLWFENLRGDGSEWRRHEILDFVWGANSIDAADVDGDGDLDVVGCSSLWYSGDDKPAIPWMENVDGAARVWVTHTVQARDRRNPPPDHFRGLATVFTDFDGDGDPDVIGADDNRRYWWENLGGPDVEWQRHEIGGFLQMNYPNHNFAVDMDHDGDNDYVASSLEGAAWWENLDGAGDDWLFHFITPRNTIPIQSSVVADFDGDGDHDLALMTYNYGDRARPGWYENLDGRGISWRGRLGPVLDSRNPCCADAGIWTADMDGDGRLELTTACWDTIAVAVWRITQFDPSGMLTSSIVGRGERPPWGTIVVDADEPQDGGAETAVTLEVRAGDDADDLGPFVALDDLAGDLSDYVDANAAFLQYRLGLESNSADLSPLVHGLRITMPCAADLDADGVVGFGDLLALLAAWGPCDECPEDLDEDGDVGFADLLSLLGRWGPCE